MLMELLVCSKYLKLTSCLISFCKQENCLFSGFSNLVLLRTYLLPCSHCLSLPFQKEMDYGAIVASKVNLCNSSEIISKALELLTGNSLQPVLLPSAKCPHLLTEEAEIFPPGDYWTCPAFLGGV